ncbi:MAG TPA: nitrite reductase (NAD(P)H) small subunit [Actinospica sp.]|nr:nitrite reductase (NAD(P)H) small subunit [Actinospica sp.]
MIKQIPVCRYEQLTPGRGVAVLLPDGTQAAVFRTAKDELYAVGNLDPATGACVISRGLTGSRAGAPTVASPMLKHVYELATGRCVDGPAGPDPAHRLPTYTVLREDEVVYLLDDPALPRELPADLRSGSGRDR